jgi:site-specific DNA-cytosine methylase
MPPPEARDLTIGSLFTGIGGWELGLERAGLGPVLWQVEKGHVQQDGES